MYERFAQENKVANEIMFLRKGGSIDQAISIPFLIILVRWML